MFSQIKRGCCTLLLLLLIVTVGFSMCVYADDTGSSTAGDQNTAAVSAQTTAGTTATQDSQNGQTEQKDAEDDDDDDDEPVTIDEDSGAYVMKPEASLAITLGKKVKISPEDTTASQVFYLTFKAKKTGYLKVTGDNFKGKIQLQKKDGTALSDFITYNNEKNKYSTAYFGVTKGTEYILCLSGKLSDAKDEFYRITVSNVSVSSYAGTKKSKAKVMKQGKTYSGVIAAGKKQTDWYRIDLDEPQSLSIKYEAKTCDALKIYFTGIGIKDHVSTFERSDEGKAGRVWTNAKIAKGTYYIKVVRDGTKSSGAYKLTWEK